MGGAQIAGRRLTGPVADTAERGRFVTLEGGDGVGKSTQAALLAEALRARGHDVILTREPGGTPGGEAIRALVLNGDAERWSAPAEALLFAAARADHVRRVIAPALAAGKWVVCDRFVDSTRAYQGGAGGVADDDILALHRIGADGLLPDRTLVLTLDADEGQARSVARDGGTTDRMGGRDIAYRLCVHLAFLRIAHADPERFRIVMADGDPPTVATAVLAALDGLV